MNISRPAGPVPDPQKPELKPLSALNARPSDTAAPCAPAAPQAQDRVQAVPLGEAAPVLSLGEHEDLSVDYHKNGKIDVRGFQPGNPPPLRDILKAAFPNARQIDILHSEHMRPYSTSFVMVDGKPFTASFLTGGIIASGEYSILPGHTREHLTPDDLDHSETRPGTARKPIALPELPLPQPVKLRAERGNDGTIVVKGFSPGNPPPIEAVIKAAFPDAKQVEVTHSSHTHPFDSYELMIDGKPFSANFLFGGIRASDQFTIRPGHGGDFMF